MSKTPEEIGDVLSKQTGKKNDSIMPADKDNFPVIIDTEEFLRESKEEFMKKYNATESFLSQGSIEDFEKIRTLGTGSFGRVMLAKHKKKKTYYAVKILTKKKVVKNKQVDHTLNEKKILTCIKFPFLVHMDYFYQDNSYLYFVMPFIMGGEMFTYLRRVGKFNENLTRFYTTQVILSFEYLHNLDLMYRDLKPENIMLDSTGYLKITDFGFCKMVEGRTYTLCGTPEYIAPEIILSKGYGKSVDWWSLGVLIYEMAAGHPPFYSNDPMKIYEKIVSGRYTNPAHFSPNLKDIIKNFLQVDVTKRYGNMKNGVQDIKDHKWLKNVDWLSVINRKMPVPYVPRIKNPGDTSHFEKYDEQPLKIASFDKFEKEFEKF